MVDKNISVLIVMYQIQLTLVYACFYLQSRCYATACPLWILYPNAYVFCLSINLSFPHSPFHTPTASLLLSLSFFYFHIFFILLLLIYLIVAFKMEMKLSKKWMNQLNFWLFITNYLKHFNWKDFLKPILIQFKWFANYEGSKSSS